MSPGCGGHRGRGADEDFDLSIVIQARLRDDKGGSCTADDFLCDLDLFHLIGHL